MFSRYQFHFILNITISLPTRHIITHEANYIVLLSVIKERTINKYKDYQLSYHLKKSKPKNTSIMYFSQENM